MFVELTREPGKKAVIAILGKCQSEVGIGWEPSRTPTTGSLGAADTGVRREGAKVEHVSLLCPLEPSRCVFRREAKEGGWRDMCPWITRGLFCWAQKQLFEGEGNGCKGGGVSLTNLHFTELTQVWRAVGGREA